MRLGFVIPVMNQMQLALETLESINTVYPHKIYLERNYIENRGVATAWNIGTRRAIADGCSIVFVLNDDIVISPMAVDHMVEVLRDKTIGVLTGCDHRNTLQPHEVATMPYPEYETDILDAPDFAFFSYTQETYETVGPFDENFHPAYFEDNDYVIRNLRAGLRPVRSQRAAFFHYGSRTQNSGSPVVPSYQFEVNRNYFVNKWGGLPGEESYLTPFNDPEKTWKDT